MADVSDFDVLILGAGSGGYACALRAAQLGLRVGLVEKGSIGGTCLHVGCIPTKALLHAAEVADNTRESEQFGVRATLEGIDMAGVNAYKDGVVQRLFKGLAGLVKARGITVIEGTGRMTGPREVTVDGTAYSAEHLVLASGSYPRSLLGLDVDGERVITSEEALRLDRVPASVVVLGGGVIGCEFASVWRSFGAEVTILEALPRLVALEDEAPDGTVSRLSGGWQVISHRALDKSKSRYLDGKLIQPYHPFTKAAQVKLSKGQVAPIDVEIFPTGAKILPGHRLRIAVQAFDIPHLAPILPDLLSTLTVITVYNSAKYPSQITIPARLN